MSTSANAPFRILGVCVRLLLLLPLIVTGQTEDPVEITGTVQIRAVDCFNEATHDHAPEYLVMDEDTFVMTRLLADPATLRQLKPQQRVTVRGTRPPAQAGALESESSAIFQRNSLEIDEVQILATTEAGGAEEALTAQGASLIVNGCSLSIGNQITCYSFASAPGPIQFNGGSINALSFNLAKPATVTFGGSSSGSLTLSSALGTGATLDWLPGTKMTLTAATDEWAATEWDGGRLLYDGQSKTALGGKSWAQVTAPDGLATGVRFVYDSGTETLHLETTALDPDADDDGIADSWETTYFPGQEATIDGSADSDGDGIADFFEYLYDSNPTDPASRGFIFEANPGASSGTVVFEWVVADGYTLGTDYIVEVSADLSNPNGWVELPLAHYSLNQNSSGG